MYQELYISRAIECVYNNNNNQINLIKQIHGFGSLVNLSFDWKSNKRKTIEQRLNWPIIGFEEK